MDCATFLNDGFTKLANNGAASGAAPKKPQPKQESKWYHAENLFPALRDTAVQGAKAVGSAAAAPVMGAVDLATRAAPKTVQGAKDWAGDKAVDTYRGLGGELGLERQLREYTPHLLGGAAGALGGAGLGALHSYLAGDESSWKRALLYSLLGGGLGVGAGDFANRAGFEMPNISEPVTDAALKAVRAARPYTRAAQGTVNAARETLGL